VFEPLFCNPLLSLISQTITPDFKVLRGKVYLLSSCSTCKRILKQVSEFGEFEVIDVKKSRLSIEQIDNLADKAGGYSEILNKQSQKYRSLDLKNKELSISDYQNLLTNEYTLLKRPVFIIDNKIFVGNGKTNIKLLTTYLASTSK